MTEAIAEALLEPVEPIEDTPVPTTLITREQIVAKLAETTPEWVPVPPEVTDVNNPFGIEMRRLSNGIRVNLLTMKAEPQKIAVRLYVPGGRMLESKNTPGSVVLGAKTMQEGGAFSTMSREEVELFCIDHMVSVEILPGDDALIIDFQSVTSPGGSPTEDSVTGFEAVMQVLHVILTDFKFEEDAFERAKQVCLCFKIINGDPFFC